MNTLTVSIRKTNLLESNRVGANYFIVTKLMQAPHINSDQNVIQSQLTDISINTHSGIPTFIKTTMNFKNFLSHQVGATSVEFSLYMAPEGADPDSPDLVQQSLFLGSGTKVFTLQTFQKLMY
jgi:hypothetical protein